MSEETIVVQLNAGSDSSAEYVFDKCVDETKKIELYGEDKSTWLKGETIYIAVNHSANVNITDVRSTAGNISDAGTATREREVEYLFKSNDPDNPTEQTLPVIGASIEVGYIGYEGRYTASKDNKGADVMTGDYSLVPFRAAVTMNYSVKLYKLVLDDEMLVDGGYNLNVVFYITVSGG